MENYNYTVTQYKSSTKPTVLRNISVEDVFQTIKNGDSNLELIQKAREFGKGNANYDFIKKNKIITHRFNFMIDKYAKNKNITASTGLIYLDADDCDTIPESEYVFAKWRSISNTGYGVLVKVDNLSITNYKYVYNELSELIGIKSDPGARSLIQQTVLSYDSNLYYNPNSIIYSYKESDLNKEREIKKVYFNNIEKKEEGISSNYTFLEVGDNATYRDNNINDYFTGENADVPFLAFPDEKTKICEPYVPFKTIEKGRRNGIMFSYLSMKASLNPHCDIEYLKQMSYDMNTRMYPKLSKYEMNTIIRNIMNKLKDGTLEKYENKERRILINPNMNFTKEEKRKITGREVGKIRSDKTSQEIYNIIESWDFDTHGKITQVKVAKEVRKGEGTVKKYWDNYKDYVKGLNADYKLCMKTFPQK